MAATDNKQPLWNKILTEIYEGLILMANTFPPVNIGAIFTENKDEATVTPVSKQNAYTPE